MKKQIFLVLLSFFYFQAYSQYAEVGEWVDYSSYHSATMIAEGEHYVYAVTEHGLIEYTKGDNSYLRFSKVVGLSDIGVSCISYNENAKTFVVGYSNGKIDLISNSEITTFTDIFRKNIGGNKSLNNIFMDGDYAYIATGFGIVKFDVVEEEFADTYVIAPNGDFVFTYDVTIGEDTIYATTDNGLRKAYLFDPQISYYESWNLDSNLPDFLNKFDIVESYGDRVYVNHPTDSVDQLYTKTGTGSWELVTQLDSLQNRSVEAHEDLVLITHQGDIRSYDLGWNETNRIYNYGEGSYVDANSAILGLDSVIWVADRNYGLVMNPKPFDYTIINPQSPRANKVDGISILNNEIWVAAGGRHNNYNNIWSSDGVYYRKENLDWDDINKYKNDGLDGVYDIISIKINPNNPNVVYAGSMGGGLIEFTDYQVSEVFNDSNSPLIRDSVRGVNISNLDYDKSGNLWIANSVSTNPIAVYTSTKEWYSYDLSQYVSNDLTGDIIVDQQGYKWVTLVHNGKGVLVFNDNGTIDDTSDDQVKILNGSPGNGGLPNTDIYSIAEDLDGEVWVGTSEGIAVFFSPSSIFTEGVNFDAQRIIVEVNGYFQYLLGTETVTAIAVDGANRKWFGTKGSGVFLMSADGTQELHHFTKDNSPLLSNFIRTIEINDLTGEVLFGTDDGIIAYKGAATGEEANLYDTYAYPNPVPENYYGLIAIKGLAANSSVKITDIAGNLVFETIAEGTQAVWDGNDMNGQRVGTGIYLVFGIDINGKNSQVAKIMFSK